MLDPRGYTATPGHLTFIYPDPTHQGGFLMSTYVRM